jgi:5-methylcytosine-specific restriction endonuclease McrA
MCLNLNPICEVCKKMGRVTTANQVDHVVSMEEGGAAFDLDNLMSLCQRHHSRKTVLRDRGFGHQPSKKPVIPGCGKDGLPIDPTHHWNRGSSSS